jgi:hypothetical protein
MLGTSRSSFSASFPLKHSLFIDQLLIELCSIGLGDHSVQEFDPKIALGDIRYTTLS